MDVRYCLKYPLNEQLYKVRRNSTKVGERSNLQKLKTLLITRRKGFYGGQLIFEGLMRKS
jgi:hypothetical protein